MKRRTSAVALDLPPVPDLGPRPACAADPAKLDRPCATCPTVTTYNTRLAEYRASLTDLDAPDIAEPRRAAGQRVLCWARI